MYGNCRYALKSLGILNIYWHSCNTGPDRLRNSSDYRESERQLRNNDRCKKATMVAQANTDNSERFSPGANWVR